MIDNNLVNNNILKTIQENSKQVNSDMLEQIFQDIIAITNIKKVLTLNEVSNEILSGSTVFYLDGIDTVLVMGTEGAEKRSIEEPQTEAVVRGPRIGFVENIETNITLIRRELKDPNLRFKTYEVGRRSKQKIVICYVADVVNPGIASMTKLLDERPSSSCTPHLFRRYIVNISFYFCHFVPTMHRLFYKWSHFIMTIAPLS